VTVDRRETGELETSLFLRYRLRNYTYGSLFTAQKLQPSKALSTLSQKSASVAENGETTATVAEFGDSRNFLRQCGQTLSTVIM